jgi:hypothetical protein
MACSISKKTANRSLFAVFFLNLQPLADAGKTDATTIKAQRDRIQSAIDRVNALTTKEEAENVADLGGFFLAYDSYIKHLKKQGFWSGQLRLWQRVESRRKRQSLYVPRARQRYRGKHRRLVRHLWCEGRRQTLPCTREQNQNLVISVSGRFVTYQGQTKKIVHCKE